jgi:hypothetical protein
MNKKLYGKGCRIYLPYFILPHLDQTKNDLGLHYKFVYFGYLPWIASLNIILVTQLIHTTPLLGEREIDCIYVKHFSLVIGQFEAPQF